jgi:hypothetical protein
MWPSLPVANQIADIVNWFFIGSLVVGVVSTILIVWMAGVKEAYWERDRTESAERVASLTVQGDQLRKDTAEANARALEARLALEKFKAPRILTADAQARLAAKLRSFSGSVFDIGIGPMGDPEPLYLSRSIHSVLVAANWQHVAWTGGGQTYTESPMPSIGLATVTNVIIDVHPNWWPKFGGAAEALAAALNAEGIDAIADSQGTSVNTEAIHIRIGRKL